MTRTIRDVFSSFCGAMNELGIPFVVVGGFAVSVWGTPRTTQDVDAIVRYRPQDVPRIADALSARSLTVDEQDLRDALDDGSHVTVFAGSTGYRVDVIPAVRPGRLAQLDSAVLVDLLGREVPVASVEATIAYKLRFGSPQDIRDAEGVYARQRRRLDPDVLGRLCTKLGVEDQLASLTRRVDEALGEAGEPSA